MRVETRLARLEEKIKPSERFIMVWVNSETDQTVASWIDGVRHAGAVEEHEHDTVVVFRTNVNIDLI